ncbi:hypothetical protein V1509DRAFT_636619 [Lipomyces kononenkoae]
MSIMRLSFYRRGFAIALLGFAIVAVIMLQLSLLDVRWYGSSLDSATRVRASSPTDSKVNADSDTAVTNDTGTSVKDGKLADYDSSLVRSLLFWRPFSWSMKDKEGIAEDAGSELESENMSSQCSDPYRQPGHLYVPESDEFDVQWIPYFETDFLNIPDPESAQYPTASAPNLTYGGPPPEIIKRSPHKWHRDLINYVDVLRRIQNFTANDSKPLDLNDVQKDIIVRLNWIHNRRVLFLSDSVDQYMIDFFCEDLGQLATKSSHPIYGGVHTTGSCHIPLLNFTIYHWHIASLYTYRPDWFMPAHVKYVAFEERFENLFKPVWNGSIGMNGQSPDLVLFQSGLWDERVFRVAAKVLEDGDDDDKLPEKQRKWKYQRLGRILGEREGRQLFWEELVFFKSRMEKFIKFIRDIFGADVPLMYRSLTMRQESRSADLAGLDMDRVTRALATKHGVEIFEWSRLGAAFSGQYMDNIHVGHGPLSYTWSNMLLYYLFRATGGVEYNGALAQFPDSVKQYVIDGQAVKGAPLIHVSRNPDTSLKFWAQCHDYNIHWGGR